MTKHEEILKRALESMEKLDKHDTEIAHMDADDILCGTLILLGFDELVDKYKEINKWYA